MRPTRLWVSVPQAWSDSRPQASNWQFRHLSLAVSRVPDGSRAAKLKLSPSAGKRAAMAVPMPRFATVTVITLHIGVKLAGIAKGHDSDPLLYAHCPVWLP